MSLVKLKDDYRKLALDMHAVVEDGEMTVAEKAEKYTPMKDDLERLSQLIQDASAVEANAAGLKGILGDTGGAPVAEQDDEGTTKSLGQQLIDDPGFRAAIKAWGGKGGHINTGAVALKAPLLSSDLGPNVIPEQRTPGIVPILFQRLTIADLMPSGTTGSNRITYVRETVATNGASTVGEGEEKPEAALLFDDDEDPVKKIAVIFKVSDEMLEDFPQLRSYIDGRLTLFVSQREEDQLLRGTGNGNDIEGLLNRSGLTAAQPKGSDTIAVAVHKEITKIRVASLLDPTALVFHPTNWEAARLEMDANGQFYGGGPFTGPYGVGRPVGQPTPYWDLPTVVTTAMTAGTVLAGAFATAAQVFRRSGITVEATNTNEDDFTKNRVTIRAEERLALAVYRPQAFGTVTGL